MFSDLSPSYPSIALLLHSSSGIDECLVIRNVKNMAHLSEWTAEELLQKVSICVTLVGRLGTGWQRQASQLYRHIHSSIVSWCCSSIQSRRDRQTGALSFDLLLLLLLLRRRQLLKIMGWRTLSLMLTR